MGRYTAAAELMQEMATEVATLPDIGVVYYRWGLLQPRRQDFLARFRELIGGEKRTRGVVITPAPQFVSTAPIATFAGGVRVRDSFSLTAFVFSEVRDDDAEYLAAMERTLAVADHLEAAQSYGDVALFTLPTVAVANFDYGMISDWGAYIGELSVSCQVDREVSLR